jgi:hypothetical protein
MQNLSHLCGPGGLVGFSSMGAGNTTAAPPPFSAPGSESEGSHTEEPYPVDVRPVDHGRTTIVSDDEHGDDSPWTRPGAGGSVWRSPEDYTPPANGPARDHMGRWVQT